VEPNSAEEIEDFPNKSMYTDEEKKYIMQRLNEQRIKEQ